MYGVECYYIPRKYLNTNTVIREVVQSKFDDAFPLEAYVQNFDAYQGNGQILSKFGVQIQDDINLVISKERFETYIQPLIRNETGIKLATRPKEGDLIWFPLDDRLYEIKFVEHAKSLTISYKVFTSTNYSVRYSGMRTKLLILELATLMMIWTPSDISRHLHSLESERLLLPSPDLETEVFNSLTSLMTEADTQVRPPLLFLPLHLAALTLLLWAITTSKTGITTSKSIKEILITNPGAGYLSPPEVVFVGGGGVGVAVTVGIATTGSIGIVTVTSGGAGYNTTPSVTFSGPTGTGITATGSVVATAGTVSAVRISNAGAGYTGGDTITVTIGAPGLLGSGNYNYNEIVTGGTSGTQARVKTWTASSKTLTVGIATGTFIIGESITGQDSGRSVYTLKTDTTDDLVTPFADNDNIETEADNILDFTERNPFGDV